MMPEILESRDRWSFQLPIDTPSRVLVDWSVAIEILVPGGPIAISIGLPFVIQDETGSIAVDPAGDPRLLGPTLRAARSQVNKVTAFKDGKLEVEFAGEVVWRVNPSPMFEAWKIGFPNGILIFGLPGGSIATVGLGKSAFPDG